LSHISSLILFFLWVDFKRCNFIILLNYSNYVGCDYASGSAGGFQQEAERKEGDDGSCEEIS